MKTKIASRSSAAGQPGSAKSPRQLVDSITTSAPKLHVHFVPRWPRNPYHGELSKHLEAFDVCVADESRLKNIAASRRRPDIVHLHALPPVSFQPAALLRQFFFWRRIDRLQRSGVKIIWTLHNVSDHESRHPTLDRMIARRCYRLADAIIVHSAGALQLVESQWRIQRRRNPLHRSSRPLHRLLSERHLHARPRAACSACRTNALVFFFLGTSGPTKAFNNSCAISKPFRRRACGSSSPAKRSPMSFAGRSKPRSGDARPSISARVFVPDAEVQTYMTAADAVVFPYTKALTSGALILAMSFGRACIAPRIGALADTLDDLGGFFFEPTGGTSLRASLAAAIARAPRLSAMGTHNRRRAAQWGWDKAARLTAAAYRACFTSASDARKPASTSP